MKPLVKKLDYEAENYYCPKCHKQVFLSWKKCQNCNQELDMKKYQQDIYENNNKG